MGRALQVISEGAPGGLRVEFIKCRRALRFSGVGIAGSGPVEVSVPPLLEQLDVDPGMGRVSVRYLLFGGMNESPRGGLRDVLGVFDSLPRAREAFVELRRGRSDDEGWGELVAFDPRGRLTPLSWFGLEGTSTRTMATSTGVLATPMDGHESDSRGRSRSLRRRRALQR